MNQRKVIWFAIAFSTVIYAFLAYTMWKPERPFEESARQLIPLVCFVLSVVMFIMAGLLSARLRSVAPQTPQLAMIVALALYESCAIFALIAAVIAHDWRIYLPGWAIAVLGFIRVWPGADETAARPGSV